MYQRLIRSCLALFATLPVALALPQAAWGQDEPDEEDEPGDEGGGDDAGEGEDGRDSPGDVDVETDSGESPRARRQQQTRKRIVREVVKGFYTKIDFGPLFWLPQFSTYSGSTGTAFNITLGGDVVDQLGFTLEVEGSFFQVVANTGPDIGISSPMGVLSPIQGDFRVFAGVAGLRAGPNVGGKKVKRISVLAHVAGGIAWSPPLIDLAAGHIASRMGTGGVMQGRALGLVRGGLGVEYYTRLSHFSLGLNVDYDLILGGPMIAMATDVGIFVKYTF